MAREGRDRRGRPRRGRAGLLERESALRTIATVVESGQTERAQALLLEGHAGIGKTRLHEAALDHARRRGLRVLRAAGTELEGDFALGVATQLVRTLLTDAGGADREALMRGAPTPIRALLTDEPQHERAPRDLSLAHGLFTIIAASAETRPVLIAIDDLQWCDGPSLEFVLYLLHRLDELRAAVVLTRRPGRGAGTEVVLDQIAAHPRIRVEAIRPLGPIAVRELARRALGDRANDAVARACLQATAGNPFYVLELLLTLAEERDSSSEELTQHAAALAPDAVARALRVRIGRLGPDAVALARAVSILGHDVPLRRAAALAGLSTARATATADALGAVEVLLAREPLGFVHPLVRRSVAADIRASERASRHREAARLLDSDGEPVERVAAHLLFGRAEGDAWAIGCLRSAAREARMRGAAQSAVRYLQRALEEPPVSEVRPHVLAELGMAEAAAGLPEAADHLAAAATVSRDPLARAKYALLRAQALYARGLHREAAQAYEAGLAQLPPDPQEPERLELHDALQTGSVATTALLPGMHAGSAERSATLLARANAGPRTEGQRVLLAQAAIHSAFAGEPAHATLELAERAWDKGRLLEQNTADGAAWSLVTAAVSWSGELERSLELIEEVLEDARRRASPMAFPTASYIRGSVELLQGRIIDACADLEQARDARRYGWGQFARAADAFYCLSLIETGELERAQEALVATEPLEAPRDLEDAVRLLAGAELRMAEGRPRQALDCALQVELILGPTIKVFGPLSWRSTAAQAALMLGDRDRALELAREELAVAERTNTLHARIRALRVLGLCEQGERRIALLRSATELAPQSPPRLESIRALVDLGAALRRANQRTAARAPLQQAGDAARRGGARALHERARTELVAAGARPRREVLLSGPASLTASERRIAELAAAGQSNREIAQGLFVTPKTVEYHLRNTFRKLNIESRRELARVLAA